MLSVQVMKHMIKLLPLLGQQLASIAIKQLHEQTITAVLNIGRYYNTNSTLVWLHPLPCMNISLAVTSYIEVGIATQDQRNPYTLQCKLYSILIAISYVYS